MRIVMLHGADHRFAIAATIERDWADALRDGLKTVGVADANELDIELAFYGDLWRPDRRDGAGRSAESVEQDPFLAGRRAALAAALSQPPSALALAIADELIPPPGEEPSWDRLSAIVDDVYEASQLCLAATDPQACQIMVRGWSDELDDYFDGGMRDKTLDRLRARLPRDRGPTLLLAHSMGSIVAYDLLATDGAKALGVTALVTFGSSLAYNGPWPWPRNYERVRDLHKGTTPFPRGLTAWTNVCNPEDLACKREPRLAKWFPRGGRRIRDVEAQGRGQFPDPGAHDPIIYLSSIALAEEVRKLLSET